MTDTVFSNAKIVLHDEIVAGSLLIRDGVISHVDSGSTQSPSEDLEGDYLIPGLVELHTDHLEGHFNPRPGVKWPALSAVMAHDAQIAASGITTVFDALRAGTFDPDHISAADGASLASAITTAQNAGQLRAQHFIHIRCELPCADTAQATEYLAAALAPNLISIMDHTPGARQFTSLDKFRQYYLGRKLIASDKIEAYIEERLELQARHAAPNKAAILDLAKRLNVSLASHDDATVAHVEEAIRDEVIIAEFPTTSQAARAAHDAGLSVLMGAPNVVRGGSHSGNISAAEVAANGHLDVLSSDYVPSSLLNAAFTLPGQVEGLSLPQVLRTVTINPARAAGLNDRGSVAEGLRADLVQVRVHNGLPVVRRVWSNGRRVM